LLLALLAALAGCADATRQKAPQEPLKVAEGGADTHKTPQEAFKIFQEAAEKGDWKILCTCITDDSRDHLAGQIAALPRLLRQVLAFEKEEKAKELKAQTEALEDVLAKHGLTTEMVEKACQQVSDPKDPKASSRAVGKALLAPIKDRVAFLVDYAAVSEKHGMGKHPVPLPQWAELEDLKLKGDSARGIAVIRLRGLEWRRPIELRHINGSWKIDLLGYYDTPEPLPTVPRK
jgi:hypothetical protein